MSDPGYADDLAYVGESNSLDSYGKMIGLNISIKKTKVMANFPLIMAFMEKPSNRWASLSN